ncbi:hypothetical protein LTR36_007178 [Oleoguttula mirabilis]|uniref:Inner centromere protein ARK-binding domain-containing protein n=1 Tax=Oleoguttula mirabilis TaxID=1507867 RepID=A0AAV9JA57_9PEZI|nr:hypothetical protein LTR36_007178 [Oleoguttula mirabilis]
MATSKTTTAPVGSAQWIESEREHAGQLIDQEAEEFGYSARNEFEWLNEHMADIFSTNQVNFADVFKTPGKLRGKTPRTARKRDALAPRQPLTDIFAPNAQIAPPTAQKNAFYDKVAHFQIAEDQDNASESANANTHRSANRSKSPQRVGKPGNTDSGYHGMTEDEMDGDARTASATVSSQQSDGQKVPLRDDQPRPQPGRQDTAGGRNSDESFISAKEDLPSRNASREELREEQDSDDATVPDDEMEVDQPEVSEALAAVLTVHEDEEEQVDDEIDEDSPRSPSDASSPGKPLQRKSSFTFSALPAREPLTAKRSIGFRDSQIDAGRGSVLGRSFGGKSLGLAQGDDDDESYEQDKPEAAKMHNKTSTQSLHERIMMLGKTKEPRTSKSIPQSVLDAQALYPQLPTADDETVAASSAPEVPPQTETHDFAEAEDDEDDDDDWIAPSKPTQGAQQKSLAQVLHESHTPAGAPTRPGMHQKSISATNIPSPSRPPMALGHQKSQSVSNPSLANAAGMIQSTTPAGTPGGKKHHDGALSASKNMLRSAFKSAKGLFASSASTSAAAKLEARNHSPVPIRSPKRDFSDDSKTAAVFNMPGALYSQQQFPQSPMRPVSVISGAPSRKTRSSTESDKKREKEIKAQQKAADGLTKVREKERQKAAKQLEEKRKADEAEAAKNAERERKQVAERPVSADSDNAKDNDMPPPPPPKSMLPAGKLRAPGRLVKPMREQPASLRPAPVSIRVASQSQRLGQPAQQSAFSKSQHESMAPPPPPPKTGLRTASAQGNVRSSTAQGNARVKALEAAARKKEADEKAAAKKVEQKREMERKRAAKAEEDRRVEEERRAAEQARVQEAKLAAQRKVESLAAEARKREQQRQQDDAQKARAAHELAEAIKRERAAQAPAHPRGDVGGTLRQLAKNTVPEHHTRNAAQANAAKPAKRGFQGEDDETMQYGNAPQRPGLQRGPASYQQNDAKRRRTNEEQEEGVERHSVMAPPKRPSNMRKESTLNNKFPHGYTHAPPPATHHTSANNMFKATVTAQHQLQHGGGKPVPSHPSQTVQMSSARIPFAENANPPAQAAQYTGSGYQPQAHHGGIENTHPSAAASNNKFKTPGRPAYHAPKSAKSSPAYPKGDNIELPDIQTDSEDEEDSDDDDNATGGFRAPSWVASPALRDLLTQQQLVDPETVFGPIGELRMEEVFKNGGKNGADRLKRFRDRGSSAAWVETGDAVTSAEKRRDMEGRERVVREGGWRYEPAGNL